MATTEQIRIATPTEAERTRISFLTPEERRDALVQAGRDKQHRNDEQIARDHLERVLEGIRTRQIRPVGIGPDGRDYGTAGKWFYSPDHNEPMTSMGRVPGRESMHALQKEDGTFAFIEDEALRPWPTAQQRATAQQHATEQNFRTVTDGIKARDSERKG